MNDANEKKNYKKAERDYVGDAHYSEYIHLPKVRKLHKWNKENLQKSLQL